jgi:hypothetical protein
VTVDRRRCEDRSHPVELSKYEGVDVSEGKLKESVVGRRVAVVAAALAVGLAGVAWSGCGSSTDTESIENRIETSLNEVEKGAEKGLKEAEKGLEKNKEAKKSFEKAKEATQEGIEKGKEEAAKAAEEAKKYKEEYAP